MSAPGPGAPVDETALTDPLLDPAFYAGDPFPLYARLRAEAPVARNDTLGFGSSAATPTSSPCPGTRTTFCSSRGIMTFEIGAEYAVAPDHDAHRPARPHPLPQPGPARLPPDVTCGRSRTASAAGPAPWSTAIEPGSPVDIVADLAVPLPLQVISDLLGVPEDEWPRFFRWSEAVIPGATDWPEEERARLEWRDGHLPAGGGRRPTHPPHATTSSASSAPPRSTATGSPTPNSGMFLVQLLVAGNETTRNMMSGGLVGFAEHPGQWEALARPAPAPGATGPCRWPSRRCCGGPLRWWPSCAPPPVRSSSVAGGSGPASRCSCSTPRPTGTRPCSVRRPTEFDAGP